MTYDEWKLATPDYFFDKEREYEHACSECGMTVEENRKDARLCYECEQKFFNKK